MWLLSLIPSPSTDTEEASVVDTVVDTMEAVDSVVDTEVVMGVDTMEDMEVADTEVDTMAAAVDTDITVKPQIE